MALRIQPGAAGRFAAAGPVPPPGEDAFRKWSWQSGVQNGTWKTSFEQVHKDARFGFERRNEGVKEARKDRSRFKQFLKDGLALKPGP